MTQLSRSTCAVTTEHASRYLQQLCKHWAHKFQVSFDPEQGRIVMPGDRTITLVAEPHALSITLDAPEAVAVKMRGVIDAHVSRFAFREELVFNWKS